MKPSEAERHNEFMSKFEQDRKAALAGKYNYLNPKKSLNVPHEYIKTVVLRGMLSGKLNDAPSGRLF